MLKGNGPFCCEGGPSRRSETQRLGGCPQFSAIFPPGRLPLPRHALNDWKEDGAGDGFESAKSSLGSYATL